MDLGSISCAVSGGHGGSHLLPGLAGRSQGARGALTEVCKVLDTNHLNLPSRRMPSSCGREAVTHAHCRQRNWCSEGPPDLLRMPTYLEPGPGPNPAGGFLGDSGRAFLQPLCLSSFFLGGDHRHGWPGGTQDVRQRPLPKGARLLSADQALPPASGRSMPKLWPLRGP